MPATALTLLAVAGCGGTVAQRSQGPGPHTPSASASTALAGPAGAFSWLRPEPPPTGWRVERSSSGAVLAYPPKWQTATSDPGSLSAALRDASGAYVGYPNVTPRQGDERQSNWATFRLRHNRVERDRDVRPVASRRGLRLAGGTGACVQDAYTTSTGARYVEVACLIGGHHPSVVVAAAPPARWRLQSPTLERAVSVAATAIGAAGVRAR